MYCTPYEVRMIAQVDFNQLNFESNGDFEDFIGHYLIPQADKRIDSYCNHSFGTPTIGTWSLDGSGKAVLFMPTERCPLIGLSGGSVNSSAVTVSDVKVHEQYVEYDGGVFTKGKLNVTLAGSYGYATLPSDVQAVSQQICVNTLTEMVRKKVLPDLYQKAEDASLIFSTTAFTKELKQALDPYIIRQVDLG